MFEYEAESSGFLRIFRNTVRVMTKLGFKLIVLHGLFEAKKLLNRSSSKDIINQIGNMFH